MNRYECECGCGFERWNAELNAYVCANCGTLWEPDIQSATLAEVAVIEAEYQDARFDEDELDEYSQWDEQTCSCPFCNCPNHTEHGEICGDCYAGVHQG